MKYKKLVFPKIIGAGCPRSGTMFLANLLTQGGVVMGHETYYGFPGGGLWRDGMVGDISWQSTPHLMNEKDKIIIQIVRNPIDQISSLKVVDFFADHSFRGNPLTNYVAMHMPDLQRYSELDRYIVFWTRWNQWIEKYATFIYRLEDLIKNPQEIFKDLQHDITGKDLKIEKINSHIRKKQLSLSDFSQCEHFNDLTTGMKHYKYKIPIKVESFTKGEVENIK